MVVANVLDRPVLQLNRNWLPIRVVSVRNAISKLYEGVAKAVIPEDYSVFDFDSWADLKVAKDEPCVYTVHGQLKIPEVIVLAVYGEIPDRKLAFSRANVYKRDRYTCQYCGARPGSEELTIDHVLPRARGGQSTWTNCVLACIRCNRRKADKTLAEAKLVLRKAPVKPNWHPRLVIAKVANTPASWERFVSDAYWNAELKG